RSGSWLRIGCSGPSSDALPHRSRLRRSLGLVVHELDAVHRCIQIDDGGQIAANRTVSTQLVNVAQVTVTYVRGDGSLGEGNMPQWIPITDTVEIDDARQLAMVNDYVFRCQIVQKTDGSHVAYVVGMTFDRVLDRG